MKYEKNNKKPFISSTFVNEFYIIYHHMMHYLFVLHEDLHVRWK